MPRLDSLTSAVLSPWFPGVDLSAIRLVEGGAVCWFVRRVLRQGAMTFAPFVFFAEPFDRASLRSIALLAHELKHVEQYRRLGHVRFLARYFRDLAGKRLRYSRALPLEAECYALQEEVALALRGSFGEEK